MTVIAHCHKYCDMLIDTRLSQTPVVVVVQTTNLSRVKFQLFDSFLGKILQPAILTHSASKVARSIAFDLKKILPSSEFQNSS